MGELTIEGGTPLHGEVAMSGSKNAALPIMAAALLTDDVVTLTNVPAIRDIEILADILTSLGCCVERSAQDAWTIEARNLNSSTVGHELAERIRGSILLMGALVGRLGEAVVAKPGGDDIGVRRVEQHIEGLRMMGAEVQTTEQEYIVRAKRLRGAWIELDMPTVTGTENLMMAATCAEGVTIIQNAAREPHVVDLARCLAGMGVRIQGAGTDHIMIEGVKGRPHGIRHAVVSDYIEAGTYLIAAAASKGSVTVTSTDPADLTWLIKKLRETGCEVIQGADHVRVDAVARVLRGVDVTTWPHPGFATDLQAQYVSLMTQAEGTSAVSEAVYEHRFRHVPELVKMGAQVVVEGRSAIVTGPTTLKGSPVNITDIRSGAALTIAALCAEGTSTLSNIFHLHRGYESFEMKLRSLGANITESDSGEATDLAGRMRSVIGD